MTPLQDLGRVHIVGIGGAGMSGIARIMVAQGVTVSGSDAKDSRRLQALRAVGVDARVGHDAELVSGIDTLVVSTAIPETNVERAAARQRLAGDGQRQFQPQPQNRPCGINACADAASTVWSHARAAAAIPACHHWA